MRHFDGKWQARPSTFSSSGCQKKRNQRLPAAELQGGVAWNDASTPQHGSAGTNYCRDEQS
jgi:hypothetical protein